MGYPDWVIFQRTDSGRAEIQNKERGLTQSERLVLIIADGVSTYAGLRIKLKSLAHQRFDRAIRKLLEKGLLYEVMFPAEGQKPDMVDPDIMDKFLRQEDDDPVSIISFDPDEEHGDGNLDQNSVARMALQNSQTPASQRYGQAAHPIPLQPRSAKVVDGSFPAISDEILNEFVVAPQHPEPQHADELQVEEPPAVDTEELDFFLPLDELAVKQEERIEPHIPVAAAKVAKAPEAASVSIDSAGTKKAVSVFPEPPPIARPKPAAKKAEPGLLASLRLNSSYILLFLGITLICAPFLARFMQWLLM
ncbi:hypothetical protein [Undibacterium terreum]|uniref:Uncharacterized protein n=1 Tax=Undibacterium terreum TaxID=1224302 RepID=A0A916XRC1_9BURK|nr:hypothetical protein [Undibacterium terreum]GGC94945.1 hypothetical protein GCM10011396_47880 [Undibacterium terreum]